MGGSIIHERTPAKWLTFILAFTSSSKEYKELLQLISRNEDKLLATMTDEQKELFTRYADCVREYQVMAECLLFQNSFRLGGRMMLEVMRGSIGDE